MYEKRPQAGQLVASASLGAKRMAVNQMPSVEKLALQIADILELPLAGLDFLEDKQGQLWALEANASFGFDASDKDLADWIAKQILML